MTVDTSSVSYLFCFVCVTMSLASVNLIHVCDCVVLPDALKALAERLKGPFNIQEVVGPIEIRISEGIMNFQDAAGDITDKVRHSASQTTCRHAICCVIQCRLTFITPFGTLGSSIMNSNFEYKFPILLGFLDLPHLMCLALSVEFYCNSYV